MTYTVVGDTLLDIDVIGTAERLSPDGAAPVVDVRATARRAGGAGLVATLLHRDGCDVRLVTALGDDADAELLRACLAGVHVTAARSGAPTPVKTRLRVGGRTLARIDRACTAAPVPRVTAAMLAAIRAAEILVVADYGRGMTTQHAVRDALARAAARGPLVWDPHPRGMPPVPGTAAATPNAAEAVAAAGGDAHDPRDVAAAADRLSDRWHCPIAVTMAEEGAILVDHAGARPVVLPAAELTVVDPCGAGDRFSSSLATGLARGLRPAAAVGFAVAAAGRYLAAGGVGTVSSPAGQAAGAAPHAAKHTPVLHRHTPATARGGTVPTPVGGPSGGAAR